MAKAKFYAIKGADGGKVVTSWPECEKLTHGVKGALFKAFGTREEAEAWVAGVTAKCPEGGLRVFVDGSFSPDYARAGWAFVAVEDGTEIASEWGVTAFPAESRNIDGELLAAYRAMRWLKMNGKEGIICHDYEGVALDLDERERLVRDIGTKNLLMLRNHGTLAVGETPAAAFLRIFFLERACKMQVLAQAGGDLLECDQDLRDKVAGQGQLGNATLGNVLAWPGLRRKLDRTLPGYDA